jgi:hypothetical protein
VYAIIKFKNPSNKAISSVTISNQRYAGNIFESSSTNEKIVLKINVFMVLL